MEHIDLALVQMASGPDWTANAQAVDSLLESCSGSDLAVLPENVFCLGRGRTVRSQARPLERLDQELGALAARHGLAVIFGGVPVLCAAGTVRNAALAYAPDGKRAVRYDKVHLFQLDPGQAQGTDETRIYAPGECPAVWDFAGWRIALSICYDIRFPELYRACAPMDLALCPMAFTARTGQAHAEILLRARAVENQCFVATASQCGVNPETGMELFGHSLAVDPWGRVLADAGPRTQGVTRVRCEKRLIREARTRLPALRNMRPGGFPSVP